MFGYLTPVISDLKVCEWQLYRAYYCGLCKQIHKSFGLLPRFLLNYDFIVPALLSDCLTNTQPHLCAQGCIANPIKKKMTCVNSKSLAQSADMLILASFYKIIDDIDDETSSKKMAAQTLRLFLFQSQKQASKRFPTLDTIFHQQSQQQSSLEQKECICPDEAAEPTAQMTSAIFAQIECEEKHRQTLSRMGYFIGKILYYLDAAEDYEKDEKKHAYNLFLKMNLSKEQAIEQAQAFCRLSAAEVAKCYHSLSLPFSHQRIILENIIFLGIPEKIQRAGTTPRTKLKATTLA